MLYKEYILNIEKIASFQRQSYEKYKQECLAQQSQENSTITEESQRLQLSRNHIDLDLKVRRKEFFVIILQHIEEESAQVNETLNSRTKDYVAEQQLLIAKKSELEETVERIRRELAAKERELVNYCKV